MENFLFDCFDNVPIRQNNIKRDFFKYFLKLCMGLKKYYDRG